MKADRNRWLVLAVISSALMLIVIDMTVLYTALPTLTYALQASQSEKLWIVNIYSLVCAGLLLGMGTLGDRLGHKKLFVGGLVVFGVASLIAAYSPNPAQLIAARALLAVGAAMMMPATLSIVRLTFEDDRERSIAIGIWAAVAAGGAAFGPVVGGLLLEHFWWGSVFLINIPVVVIALVLAVLLIPSRPGNSDRPWDFVGSLQAMVCLIALAYAIKEFGKRDISLAAALVALVIGISFAALFVFRQRKRPYPLLDFGIFRNRRFSTAVSAALISAAALMGMELVFVQRLQLVQDLSPLQAGIFILPLPLAAFVAGPLAGYMLPKLGAKTLLTSALLISAAGMAAYLFIYDAPRVYQVCALAVLGFGLGAAMTAASSTIMQSAPAEQAGMAASVEEVSYELGGALGVTLMGSLLAGLYSAKLSLPDSVAVPDQVYLGIDEALALASQLDPAQAQVLVEAAKATFDIGFLAVMAACAALLFMASAAVFRYAGERTPEAKRVASS